MRTSTKRILSVGIAGILFLGALFVYGSLIRPEFERIQKSRSLVASKAESFANLNAAVSQVEDLIRKFQSIARLEEVVSLALPKKENVTQVLNQINAAARMSGVSLGSFSARLSGFLPAQQPFVKRRGILEVEVGVRGLYEGVKGFLKALETNVRIANVKNFSIKPFSPVEEIYTLDISMEMFYQEE